MARSVGAADRFPEEVHALGFQIEQPHLGNTCSSIQGKLDVAIEGERCARNLDQEKYVFRAGVSIGAVVRSRFQQAEIWLRLGEYAQVA